MASHPVKCGDQLAMKQTKSKRTETPLAALLAVVESAAGSASAAPKQDATKLSAPQYTLNSNCTVRDSIALKSALLDLVAERQPVTIDARAVERIDTAALQVLCAFTRDRRAAGGQVIWAGGTDNFCEAIRLLGLQKLIDVPGIDALVQSGGRA
jgi:anti-anti-sigma regulatory factor